MELEKIFFDTVDEFNKAQNEFEIDKKKDFLLIGTGSTLDSLATVNFFTRLEKNIFKILKKEIDIINNIFTLKKDKISIQDLLIFLEDNI